MEDFGFHPRIMFDDNRKQNVSGNRISYINHNRLAIRKVSIVYDHNIHSLLLTKSEI